MPLLIYLLALLALFLSDLRPHLSDALKGRFANVLLVGFAAPLVPTAFAGGILGAYIYVRHRESDWIPRGHCCHSGWDVGLTI
jgi:hypothetical protein